MRWPLLLFFFCFCNLSFGMSETVAGEKAIVKVKLNNDAPYEAALQELLQNRPKRDASQESRLEYLFRLTSAWSNMRQYEKAEGVMRTIIDMCKPSAFLYSNLSVYMGKQGKYKQAEEAAQKALTLDAGYTHAKLVLASWQWNLDKKEEALRNFDSIPIPSEGEHDDQRMYYGCMACFFADVGDEEKVEYAISKCLELNPAPTGKVFFQRDVVFDKYRGKKWFIDLVGETLVSDTQDHSKSTESKE